MSNLRTERVEVRLSPDEETALRRVAKRWDCDKAEALRRAVISFDTNGSHVVSVALDQYDLEVATDLARHWRTDEAGAVRKAFHAFNGLMEVSRIRSPGDFPTIVRQVEHLAHAVDDPTVDAPLRPKPTRKH